MSKTIAAIATGAVVSAIGIVRMSGDLSAKIANEVFFPFSGKKLDTYADRELVYGEIRDDSGAVIDICLCTVSHAPHSYTGEDTAEFQLHGSPVVLEETMALLFSHGARQAQAGEFTKRAFLNSCMDLTQAEAVIDLIHAQTREAAKIAAGQLGGAIFKKAEGAYSELTDIMSHYHAVLDYPDEDIDEFAMQKYIEKLREIEGALSKLLANFERGKIVRDGILSAIIGKPNVGKSSVLNTLLGYDRAIVTDIAGTTRDTIEEKIRIGEVLLRLVDTAGIRKTDDTVENIGVVRSVEALERAKLVIAVFDASSFTAEDEEIIALASKKEHSIALINKDDITKKAQLTKIETAFSNVCYVSAKNDSGFDALETMIAKMFPKPEAENMGEVLTNMRQAEAVKVAIEAIGSAIEAQEQGLTPDAALMGIEDAMQAIAELTGKKVREDITNRIFERFCVGK